MPTLQLTLGPLKEHVKKSTSQSPISSQQWNLILLNEVWSQASFGLSLIADVSVNTPAVGSFDLPNDAKTSPGRLN